MIDTETNLAQIMIITIYGDICLDSLELNAGVFKF